MPGQFRRYFVALSCCAGLLAGGLTMSAGATPMADAFTYQGRLTQNGDPVTGPVNFSFQLHAHDEDPDQIGPTLNAFGFEDFDDDGRFTIDLEFGKSVFDGTPLWLEIWVNGAPLSPRQPILPAPYSMRALSVSTVGSDSLSGSYANEIQLKNPANQISGVFDGSGAGLTDLNASNINSGTIGSSLLSGTYSNALTLNNASNVFTGNGMALTNLNASNLASGTVPSARLSGTYSSALTFSNASNSFTGIGSGLSSLNASNISTGTIANARTTGTATNAANTLVLRDASGNFAASTITGSFSGNGALLTALNASNISTGTLSVTRMPTGGNWVLSSNLNIGTGIMLLSPSTQRVGVGTNSPQSKLHVFTNADNDLFYNPAIYARNTSPVDFHTVGVQGETTGAAGRGIFGFADHASGNVVGVWGETTSSNGRGVYGFASSASGSTIGVYGQVNSATGWAGYFTGGRNYMQGDLGIGTTTPSQKLHVVGNVNATGNYRVNNQVAISASQEFFANPSASALPRFGLGDGTTGMGLPATNTLAFWVAGVERIRVTNAGRVGIGVTSPGFRLELPNLASVEGRGRANAWETYSSGRWKDNVEHVENALDTVLALQGVTFDWTNGSDGTRDIGFIAEEVGAIVPELVTWEEDGSGFAKSLKYDRISAITVEAIKEQQAQIERLHDRIAQLETLLEIALGIKDTSR
jgi:hypothetical protein